MIKRRLFVCFFASLCLVLWGFTALNGAYADSEATGYDSFSEFIASVETEELNKDVEYKLWESVSLFESGRDSAQGYIYRFDVSSDGKSVALGFTNGERSSVAVFSVKNDGLKLEYGFDIALSEAFEICFVDEGLAVWLRGSNVVFAIGSDGEIAASKRLVLGDESAEDAVKTPILEKTELFFSCGSIEKSTASGEVYFLDSLVGDGDGVQYSRLVRRNADGSETVVYEALEVAKIGNAIAVIIGFLAVILTVSAVGCLVFERLKRKG